MQFFFILSDLAYKMSNNIVVIRGYDDY